MTQRPPNAAQIPLPENAETLVMSPRELALYQAGEAMGQVKGLRNAASFMLEIAKRIKEDPAAGQLAALLDQMATKARTNTSAVSVAKMVNLANQEEPEEQIEPKLVLSWADLANALELVKDQPLAYPKVHADAIEQGASSLQAQATQGTHVFAAKVAEAGGITAQQVKAKPSLLGAVARVFLEKLAER